MSRLIRWWDRLTMPPPAKNQIEYQTQMRERQAYFVSRILLLIVFACLITVVIKLFNPGPRHLILVPLSGLLFAFLIGILNRTSHATLAGFGVLFAATGTMVGAILTHVPFLETDLPLFYLLAVTEVLAGMLLPAVMIFGIAALNCALVLIFLYTFPLAESFKEALYSAPEGIFLPLLSLLLEIAVGTYFLVRGLSKAIYRASDAEHVAQLESERAKDRQRLHDGIFRIAQDLSLAEKGNRNIRISMREGDVLWEIASPLNYLLDELTQVTTEASRLQQVVEAIEQVLQGFERFQQDDLDPDQIIHALRSTMRQLQQRDGTSGSIYNRDSVES